MACDLGRARQSARAAELHDDRGRSSTGRSGSAGGRRGDELDRDLVPDHDGRLAADRRKGGRPSRSSQCDARRPRLFRARIRRGRHGQLDSCAHRVPHQSGDRGRRPHPQQSRRSARGDSERPTRHRVRDRDRGDRRRRDGWSARRGISRRDRLALDLSGQRAAVRGRVSRSRGVSSHRARPARPRDSIWSARSVSASCCWPPRGSLSLSAGPSTR